MKSHIFLLLVLTIFSSFHMINGFSEEHTESSSIENDANQLYIHSQNQIAEGNLETALQLINKSLEIDPTKAEYLTIKGRILILMEDYEKARIFLEDAKLKHPKNGEILINLGATYVKLNMPVDALMMFSKAMNVDPEMEKIASSNSNLIKDAINYQLLDGTLEILLHDSDNNLLGHIITQNVRVIDHEVTDWEIDTWPVKEIITKNDKKFEIRQRITSGIMDKGYFGQTARQHELLPLVYTFFTHHNGALAVDGDKITYVYTVSRPVD